MDSETESEKNVDDFLKTVCVSRLRDLQALCESVYELLE